MIPLPILGFICGAGGMLVATLAGWGWLAWVHDPAVRAAQVAEIAALTAKQQAADQAAALAAVQKLDVEQTQREATRTIIRERIVRVPVTTACAGSAAIVAAVDGLRAGGSSAGAPGVPAIPAGLPGATGTAPRPVR